MLILSSVSLQPSARRNNTILAAYSSVTKVKMIIVYLHLMDIWSMHITEILKNFMGLLICTGIWYCFMDVSAQAPFVQLLFQGCFCDQAPFVHSQILVRPHFIA
jgi:hypothetical protein